MAAQARLADQATLSDSLEAGKDGKEGSDWGGQHLRLPLSTVPSCRPPMIPDRLAWPCSVALVAICVGPEEGMHRGRSTGRVRFCLATEEQVYHAFAAQPSFQVCSNEACLYFVSKAHGQAGCSPGLGQSPAANTRLLFCTHLIQPKNRALYQ